MSLGNRASAYTKARDAVARTGSGYRRIVNTGPVSVVSLGAWCDLDAPTEESRACGTSFRVREFALLSDGREVTVLAGRGGPRRRG